MEKHAYVALGSNLGRREQNVLEALRHFDDGERVRVLRISSLYQSDAVGMGRAPAFVNAVAELVTLLQPRDLLERMQTIEVRLGRTSGHNQSREIDLDLIAFADEVLDERGLTVPHPRYRERAFVLVPLAEIAPSFRDPVTGASIAELAGCLPATDGMYRISGRDWVARA